MDIAPAAERLRAEAAARPLRLPVRRRVDEAHHHVTEDGLGVWYTFQVAPHATIREAVFEREGAAPTDAECALWAAALSPDRPLVEAPGIPGGHVRRFEAFERAVASVSPA